MVAADDGARKVSWLRVRADGVSGCVKMDAYVKVNGFVKAAIGVGMIE